MTAEIVHDHDVAKTKGRQQKKLLDLGPKDHAVDWPLDEPWRIDPVIPQGCQEGRALASPWGT